MKTKTKNYHLASENMVIKTKIKINQIQNIKIRAVYTLHIWLQPQKTLSLTHAIRCQLPLKGRWSSPESLVFSISYTDRRDLTQPKSNKQKKLN